MFLYVYQCTTIESATKRQTNVQILQGRLPPCITDLHNTSLALNDPAVPKLGLPSLEITCSNRKGTVPIWPNTGCNNFRWTLRPSLLEGLEHVSLKTWTIMIHNIQVKQKHQQKLVVQSGTSFGMFLELPCSQAMVPSGKSNFAHFRCERPGSVGWRILKLKISDRVVLGKLKLLYWDILFERGWEQQHMWNKVTNHK